MSELAAKLCEFIRLGLIKANQMLPISDDDWEIILQNWKPAKNQHQINENKNQLKAMGVVIPAYWYQCIQSHFKYRVD